MSIMDKKIREEILYNNYLRFMKLVIGYLQGRDILDKIRRKFQEDDFKGRGFWSKRTEREVMEGLVKLTEGEGDEDEWGLLLAEVAMETHFFKDFKQYSPFRDKIIVIVDYGGGFVRFHGDGEDFLSKILEANGHSILQGEKYLVVLPRPEKSDVKILTLKA